MLIIRLLIVVSVAVLSSATFYPLLRRVPEALIDGGQQLADSSFDLARKLTDVFFPEDIFGRAQRAKHGKDNDRSRDEKTPPPKATKRSVDAKDINIELDN